MEAAAEHLGSTEDEELSMEEIFVDPTNLTLSEEKQKNVLIKYIQEKRDLQEQLESKEKAVQEYKAKVYDLTNQIDHLKQEVSNLKKNSLRAPPLANRSSNLGSKSPMLNRTGIVRPSTTKSKTKAKPSKKKSRMLDKIGKQDSVGSKTSDSTDQQENEDAQKTLERYKAIATRFPELKFSVMLEAEKVFYEADINHDGTIDENELEIVLEKQGHYMTTKKEVKEIMKEIDKDDTGTIDLMEYMAVMERVQMRKRTNLPPQLTKSTVCAIQ